MNVANLLQEESVVFISVRVSVYKVSYWILNAYLPLYLLFPKYIKTNTFHVCLGRIVEIDDVEIIS